ncbi:Rpn family recombination-promoting nuclease/putative transposase [Schaedlerella arabinosiphila]|uniref:Rpn family recombination-promoting nuclease/putative transposase n=1 Tax=Schaedlerella arabinosiphila TaxID=2044587 RepID=A0A3R8JQ37_9FIRM|nr:Rpn family recombination-promoting nuclease/putative transposase [Schaedlerella arabinosiphila]
MKERSGRVANTNTFIMKPKIDFCFKELMEFAEVRRGFIAAVLGISPEEVVSTELKPTYLRVKHQKDKLGILDVHVILNGEIQIDMEIQVAQFLFWRERSLFYLSKMYSDVILAGEGYQVLGKCIHVGILDFILFEEDEEYYSCFHLWEDKRRRIYSDKLEIHIVELPKLAEREYPETALLKWARFFNAEKKEEFEMVAKTDPHIQKAYDQLLYMSGNEEKRLLYEARQKAINDYNTQMYSNWHDGYSEGEEKKLIELICKKMKKNCSAEEIADLLEEDKAKVETIYNTALDFAPDYNIEKIWKKLGGRKKQTAV